MCFSRINCAILFAVHADLMKLCCSSSWAVALSSGFLTNILDKKSCRYGDTWIGDRRNGIKRLTNSLEFATEKQYCNMVKTSREAVPLHAAQFPSDLIVLFVRCTDVLKAW